AERGGERLDQLREVLRRLEAAAARDDHLRLGELELAAARVDAAGPPRALRGRGRRRDRLDARRLAGDLRRGEDVRAQARERRRRLEADREDRLAGVDRAARPEGAVREGERDAVARRARREERAEAPQQVARKRGRAEQHERGALR